MKITLFTSNKNRHNYLINCLEKICEKLFVIQEFSPKIDNIIPTRYPSSEIMKEYFSKVYDAQTKFFGNSNIKPVLNTTKVLPLAMGNLKNCTISSISEFLESDLYIVFGSSYIKGELIDFLIKKKTINIHMGVSPYYRGTDCNFWALYDNNPHLVGATIHLISKGLDDGPILFHALSNFKKDPFEYTMSTVMSAFKAIMKRIEDESIFSIKSSTQDINKEIRFTKAKDFNEEIVKDFFSKKLDLNSKETQISLFKDPFILPEKF